MKQPKSRNGRRWPIIYGLVILLGLSLLLVLAYFLYLRVLLVEANQPRVRQVALADLTGNWIVDILLAGVTSYQVWQGEGNGRFTPGPLTDYRY